MYGLTDFPTYPSQHITEVVSERLNRGDLEGLQVKVDNEYVIIGDDRISCNDLDDLAHKLESRVASQFIAKTSDLETFFHRLEEIAKSSPKAAQTIHQIVDKLHSVHKAKDVFDSFLQFCDSVLIFKEEFPEKICDFAETARQKVEHLLDDETCNIESIEKKSNELIATKKKFIHILKQQNPEAFTACAIALQEEQLKNIRNRLTKMLAEGRLNEVEINVEADTLLIDGIEIDMVYGGSLDAIWEALQPHIVQNTDEIAQFYSRLGTAAESLSDSWKLAKYDLKTNLEIVEGVKQQKTILESLISVPETVVNVLNEIPEKTQQMQDFITLANQLISNAKEQSDQSAKGIYKGNHIGFEKNIALQLELTNKFLMNIEEKAPRALAEIMKRLDVKESPSGLSRLHVGAMLETSDVVLEELDDLTISQQGTALQDLSHQHLTPLQEASFRGNYGAAKALLDAGADIDDKSSPKVRSLGIAAMQGNLQMLQLLIDSGADPFCCNSLGESIFQIAIEAGKEEVLEMLLKNEKMLQALDAEDIFGHTARQKAYWSGNARFHELIQQYAPSSAALQPKPPAINQIKIIESLKKFIQLHNGDVNLIPEKGNCYGLSFLQHYYFSKGKADHFYRVLELISAWDGTVESLKDASTVEGLPVDCKNLEELMTQWTNDIVWFQGMHNLEKMEQEHNRTHQWKMVAPEGETMDERNIVRAGTIKNYTSEELISELEALEKGSCLDIGVCHESEEKRSAHQVCVTRNTDGTYAYYDSNLDYKLKPFNTAEEVVSLIRNIVSVNTLKNKSLESIPIGELTELKFEFSDD